MENLSNFQAVIITPAIQILPIAALIGLVSGVAGGLLSTIIVCWQSRSAISLESLISNLFGYSLIGVLLLTTSAFLFWNSDPTKSVSTLCQECLIVIPALFVVPISELLSSLHWKGLDGYNIFRGSVSQGDEEE
ncbi:MAG: hypothetical protein HC800_25430 [Phormidesmis sp. RL_2_1]|nr:hypothetical protein [Phormidesmis sp. RL_2_1]